MGLNNADFFGGLTPKPSGAAGVRLGRSVKWHFQPPGHEIQRQSFSPLQALRDSAPSDGRPILMVRTPAETGNHAPPTI